MEQPNLGNLLPVTRNFWVSPIDKAMAEVEHVPPFYAMNEPQMGQHLRTAIAKVLTMHGIKVVPTPAEMGLITKMINATFKYNRLNYLQFEQAFEFNLGGEYSETHKPFGLFSVEFMCAVLNEYTHRHEISVKERPKQTQHAIAPTPEQLAENDLKFKNTILSYYAKYCANPDCHLVNPTDIFLFLERAGLINETVANKKEIFEQARKKHLRELQQLNQNDPRVGRSIESVIINLKNGGIPETETAMVKIIARELTLRKWFAMWKETGFDLTGALFVSRQETIF